MADARAKRSVFGQCCQGLAEGGHAVADVGHECRRLAVEKALERLDARRVRAGLAGLSRPLADRAGVKALQRFLDGKPPSFVTDISYRMAAFRKADNSPEDSQLSLDEFKALMKDLPLSKEIDVELLFHQADANKDGVLVFDEFVNCFEHVTGSALAQ